MKTYFSQYKADFLTGMANILPVAVSILIVIWLFGKVINLTDIVFIFVPKTWMFSDNDIGQIHFYWNILSLLMMILLIGLLGRIAQNSFGKKLIQTVDKVLLHIPLLSKIYSILKHISSAFTPSKTTTYKQVVLVEFPRPGIYSVGFITSAKNNEVSAKTFGSLLSVFIPTPPLTSGFVILVRETEIVKLDMSVTEGIKFIMSLGSVSPAYLTEGYIPNTEMTYSKGSGIPKNAEAMMADKPDDSPSQSFEG